MDAGPDGTLRLDALQRDVLLAQIQAFIDAAPESEARSSYLALKTAVEAMEVAPEHQGRLGAILEIALQSGRIRRLFGPGAEVSLNSLFKSTPRGRELAGSLADVNRALAALKDDAIEEISASLPAPGAWSLTIRTARCQIVLRFERDGVRVDSLEVAVG
jgi:hypothetical protein